MACSFPRRRINEAVAEAKKFCEEEASTCLLEVIFCAAASLRSFQRPRWPCNCRPALRNRAKARQSEGPTLSPLINRETASQ